MVQQRTIYQFHQVYDLYFALISGCFYCIFQVYKAEGARCYDNLSIYFLGHAHPTFTHTFLFLFVFIPQE